MTNEKNSGTFGYSLEWDNWSGNIQYTGSSYYFKPETKADLQAILADAKTRDIPVRVSGQRHSQPPLVVDDNRTQTPPPEPTLYLVDMSCYVDIGDKGMQLGPGTNQVTVNPGVREGELDAFLTKNDLILDTVTAGGFFSLGGMAAVDVHGGTINAPIFAETTSAFTIMDADGQERVIDSSSTDGNGHSALAFARVSLGALGIVTRMVIDVLPRPFATTLRGGRERYLLEDKAAFTAKFHELLTGPAKHTRMEVFYTPYAVSPATNFLTLWWDVIDNPDEEIPNLDPDPTDTCELASEGDFGAPLVGGIGKFMTKFIRRSQYFRDPYSIIHFPSIPPSKYVAFALKNIESQADKAFERYSDLWLGEAAQVMFMSYFVELPTLDEASLEKVWDGLQVAGDYVLQPGNFHIAAPMEFRFIKGGDSVMSATYTNSSSDVWYINFDLIGFIEPTLGSDYPEALLKFFAYVERQWVAMGGLPHNGKMYGFYNPDDPSEESFTAPFNPNFLKFTTQRRIDRGAPVEAFKQYRQVCDPQDRFYNEYLRSLLEG